MVVVLAELALIVLLVSRGSCSLSGSSFSALLRRTYTGLDGRPAVLEERVLETFPAQDPAWEARFPEAMSRAPLPLRLSGRGGDAVNYATAAGETSVGSVPPGPASWASRAVRSTSRTIVSGRSDWGAWPAASSGRKRDRGTRGR
jgi:hypothetical protein